MQVALVPPRTAANPAGSPRRHCRPGHRRWHGRAGVYRQSGAPGTSAQSHAPSVSDPYRQAAPRSSVCGRSRNRATATSGPSPRPGSRDCGRRSFGPSVCPRSAICRFPGGRRGTRPPTTRCWPASLCPWSRPRAVQRPASAPQVSGSAPRPAQSAGGLRDPKPSTAARRR